MSYVRHVLQPGETIRHESRVHWIVYLPGIALSAAGLIGFGYLAQDGDSPAFRGLLIIALVAGLLSIVSAWFRRWTTEIAVTDRRVIYKRGFIRRRTIEMNMDKVESVDVNQSIPGRILDYGTIIVRGTGAGIEPLTSIDSPIEFRNSVTAK